MFQFSFLFGQGNDLQAGLLARRKTADPPSEAPLQTIGSYVAAAQEARERALLVSAAQVRLKHEASLWRGIAAPKRSITGAASAQVRCSGIIGMTMPCRSRCGVYRSVPVLCYI